MLKKHVIDILTRMNPETKSYDSPEWDQANLKKLLETQLDKVYKDTEMMKQNRRGDGGLTFKQYLECIFDNINQSIHSNQINML